jgi:hypothetical protein
MEVSSIKPIPFPQSSPTQRLTVCKAERPKKKNVSTRQGKNVLNAANLGIISLSANYLYFWLKT